MPNGIICAAPALQQLQGVYLILISGLYGSSHYQGYSQIRTKHKTRGTEKAFLKTQIMKYNSGIFASAYRKHGDKDIRCK
jgi:hypothetical protein